MEGKLWKMKNSEKKKKESKGIPLFYQEGWPLKFEKNGER